MGRRGPKAMELDWSKIERAIKIGLMPFEVCTVIGSSVPFDKMSELYRKYYDSFEDLQNVAERRILRGTKTHTKKQKAIGKLRATIKQHVAAMVIREMGNIDELIGYPIEDLYHHLNSNLKEGMTWEERSKWHIDHIKPASSFNTKQLKECFDLKNLRPLWAKENMSKGRKHE